MNWQEALAQLTARALASQWSLEPPHPEEFARAIADEIERLTKEQDKAQPQALDLTRRIEALAEEWQENGTGIRKEFYTERERNQWRVCVANLRAALAEAARAQAEGAIARYSCSHTPPCPLPGTRYGEGYCVAREAGRREGLEEATQVVHDTYGDGRGLPLAVADFATRVGDALRARAAAPRPKTPEEP